ncbi:MAG: Na/Pi cotransporter family protein, partial [Myxococcota bacterium]|nr:Na/Pi cotransporter family protein [Myxococcota bacterium]
GANIGTTSTAALASIGATSGARRVAAGHAAFNLLTGAVALATLPLLLLAMDRLRGALALSGEPAAVLAGFHTVFNLLGVALMWPLTDRLVGFLERRFRTREEDEARPRHLDANVARTPLAGLRAMALELMRAHAHVRRMAALAIEEGPRALERVRTSRVATTRLLDAIGGFSTSLQRGRMSDAPGEALPETLRVLRHVAEAAELAEAMAAAAPAEWLPRPLDDERRAFEAEVAALLATAVPDAAKPGPEEIGRAMERVDAGYHALKSHLLRAGAGGDLGVGTLVAHLDRLSDVRRTAQQLERGARRLRAVMALLEGAEPPPTPADGAAGA